MDSTTNVETEFEQLLAKAAAGDADAQLAIAKAHGTGNGAPKDMAEAFSWCERAAQQSQPEAMYLLSESYRIGLGVARDAQQARQWRQAAIKAGWAVSRQRSVQPTPSVWGQLLKFVAVIIGIGIIGILLIMLVLFIICSNNATNWH